MDEDQKRVRNRARCTTSTPEQFKNSFRRSIFLMGQIFSAIASRHGLPSCEVWNWEAPPCYYMSANGGHLERSLGARWSFVVAVPWRQHLTLNTPKKKNANRFDGEGRTTLVTRSPINPPDCQGVVNWLHIAPFITVTSLIPLSAPLMTALNWRTFGISVSSALFYVLYCRESRIGVWRISLEVRVLVRPNHGVYVIWSVSAVLLYLRLQVDCWLL